MLVTPIPALEDNYMYMITSGDINLLVDPIELKKLEFEIKTHNYPKPTAILTTHHHWDHAGGNLKALKLFGDIDIYGGDLNRIEGCSKLVHDSEILKFGSLKITCIHTPCHTKSHICYYVIDQSDNNMNGAVFTGDTLFIGGCGKFFEGTAEEMNTALNVKLASLPPATKVYCGHEYTVNNLKFCMSIEPQNDNLSKKLEWALNVRNKKLYTVPSTIQDELDCNVFMRVDKLKQQLGCSSSVKAMDLLRTKKNNFKCYST